MQKILYMFYLTNHYQETVRFKVVDVLERLQSNFKKRTKSYEYMKNESPLVS